MNDDGKTGELVDDDPNDNSSSQSAEIVRVEYSGPLPPASEYAAYEETTPGAGDRILTLTEEQSKHRQLLELEDSRAFHAHCKEELRLDGRRTIYGQYFAAIALIMLTGLAWRALELGNPRVAGAIITVGLVSVVAVFVTGRIFTSTKASDEDDED